MQIVANFTDAYGIPHTDAVFIVTYATKSKSESTHLNYDQSSKALVQTINVNENLNYEMSFWHSRAAQFNNAMLMRLPDLNAALPTYVTIGPEHDGLSIEQIAIDHFKSTVIPAIGAELVEVLAE